MIYCNRCVDLTTPAEAVKIMQSAVEDLTRSPPPMWFATPLGASVQAAKLEPIRDVHPMGTDPSVATIINAVAAKLMPRKRNAQKVLSVCSDAVKHAILKTTEAVPKTRTPPYAKPTANVTFAELTANAASDQGLEISA